MQLSVFKVGMYFPCCHDITISKKLHIDCTFSQVATSNWLYNVVCTQLQSLVMYRSVEL
jgi:hypothetical protein